MRILVLGGTKFLGRHTVDAALARGHDVTLFNRGQTNPELFPDVEKLQGDRDGDLAALAGQSFDAVVDTSGFVPRVVQQTLDALGDVGHYTFVSTISVYADVSTPPTESSPVGELEDETDEAAEHYGELKADCEDAVRARFPDAFIPRPGLIVGPWDPTGRFTYWPQRLAAGGRVLAPAPPGADAQVIDARDLAAWIVRAAENGTSGTFNAVDRPCTRETLIDTCRAVAATDVEIVWVDPEFLLEHEVGEWMELPLWLAAPEYAGMLSVDPAAAFAAGLETRPLEETVRDTLEWARSGDAPIEPPAGLDREKEQAVLDAWLSKE
jgi:2'-hydroxyisoflavone reductase